jgi:hypothetical protein
MVDGVTRCVEVFGMQAKIVTICSTVAELGVFFAAALALVLGLTSLR